MHVSTQDGWARSEVGERRWWGPVYRTVLDVAPDINTVQVFRELMAVAEAVTVQHDEGSGRTRVQFKWQGVQVWDSDLEWGVRHPIEAAYRLIHDLQKEVATRVRDNAAATPADLCPVCRLPCHYCQ